MDPRWFHVTTHSYGAWLPGDPRGFRTRHHREHVDGDYRNPPPPGAHEEQLRRSRELLKQPPVVLTPEWRKIVGEALVEMLLRLEAQLLCLSCSGQHVHLLAKMPPGPVPRQWVGRAKKHATFIAKEHGWTGKLWAVRCKPTPIKDRQHQLNVFNYILRHRNEGAWIWDFREHQKSKADQNAESPGSADPGLSATPCNPPAQKLTMLPIPQLLSELVRRPSVNPMGRSDLDPAILYESRVTDFYEAQLRDLGVPYERVPVQPGRDNLVARYVPPTAPPFSVLWEAHQDTVPVDGMTIAPFGGVIDGDRLWGRGACDVKAGGVAMLAAFARLVKEKPPGSAAVTLAFTVDEEHTFLGIQHLVKSGVRTDCAIIAEPTELNIVRAHKGVARWAFETGGVACHSSRPENGVSAIYRMAHVLRAVETYAAQLRASRTDPLLGPPTISVGMISGGVSPNTVPDKCRIEIDRRLLPGEDANAVVAEVEAFVKAFPGVDFPVATVRHMACPALPPTGSEKLVAQLGASINSVVGKHEVVGVPYGTDASTVALAGVPSVVFGPGNIAQAHTKDEWVHLPQIEQAAEILFRFACGR